MTILPWLPTLKVDFNALNVHDWLMAAFSVACDVKCVKIVPAFHQGRAPIQYSTHSVCLLLRVCVCMPTSVRATGAPPPPPTHTPVRPGSIFCSCWMKKFFIYVENNSFCNKPATNLKLTNSGPPRFVWWPHENTVCGTFLCNVYNKGAIWTIVLLLDGIERQFWYAWARTPYQGLAHALRLYIWDHGSNFRLYKYIDSGTAFPCPGLSQGCLYMLTGCDAIYVEKVCLTPVVLDSVTARSYTDMLGLIKDEFCAKMRSAFCENVCNMEDCSTIALQWCCQFWQARARRCHVKDWH